MTASKNLVLDVLETDYQFSFSFDTIEELVMGRKDPDTGESPEIDLSDANAYNKGVSRRHAIISRREEVLYVTDIVSASCIFLNEQRVAAYQSRMLRHGDDIRLGRLVLRVSLY